MSPQPRGFIPPEHAEAIRHAMAGLEAAQAARDAAIVAGLLAGGSVAEMHELTGLASKTIQKIGHAGGWPSRAYKQARAEAAARARVWRDLMSMDPVEVQRLLDQARPPQDD